MGYIEKAFHKEGLGDIDVVWGEVQGSGKDAKGFGLAKILEKHAKAGEFKDFGKSVESQMTKAINEIISNGKTIDENGRISIVLNKDDKVYRLGLKGNWKGKDTQKWVITAYEDTREANKTIRSNGFTKEENLSLNSKEDSSTNAINNSTLKEFGENYPEFQGKGIKAIEHLLKVKQGQVAGAFHKEGLGEGKNEWILTVYKRENPPAQNFDQVTNSKELEIVETISL